MTTETTSRNNFDGADAKSMQLITVKEAAQRLGVSRSKVYRINREIGPLRFVIDGRWIFIDQASLETHIANSRRISTNDGFLAVGRVLPCQQPANESETQSETDEVPFTAPAMATLNASLSTSTRQGQRELMMPEYRHPFAIFHTY